MPFKKDVRFAGRLRWSKEENKEDYSVINARTANGSFKTNGVPSTNADNYGKNTYGNERP
jgi:hypothetical protein